MSDEFNYKEFRSSQHVKAFQESVKEWFNQYVFTTVADPFHIGSREDYMTWYSSNSNSSDDLITNALINAASPIFLGMFDLVLEVGLKTVGSPIELMMYLALCLNTLIECDGLIVQPTPENETEKIGILKFPSNSITTIQPQVQINKYRVDFLISTQIDTTIKGVRYKGASQLVVECDGHEFHEKTKEQVSHDKKRDRDLMGWGYKVFRFSGADIYNQPILCAYETITHVNRHAWAETRLPKNREYPIFRYIKKDE